MEIDGVPTRTYRAGQAYAEPVDQWTNAINRGSSPARFLAVFAAEEGVPLLVRQ